MSGNEDSGESTWGSILGLPSTLWNLGDGAEDLLRRPESFILGTVATWLITQFVIRPVAFLTSGIESAFNAVENAFEGAYDEVADGLGGVGESLVAIPAGILESFETFLTSLGLAAPIASAVAAVVLLVAFWTVVIVIGRMLVDVVPGAGGLIR